MEFEWDPDKRETNILKHGVDFADAISIFLDERRLEGFDERNSGEEERWWAMGAVRSNVLFVVYTERREAMRIISARKATSDEQKAYYEGFSA